MHAPRKGLGAELTVGCPTLSYLSVLSIEEPGKCKANLKNYEQIVGNNLERPMIVELKYNPETSESAARDYL